MCVAYMMYVGKGRVLGSCGQLDKNLCHGVMEMEKLVVWKFW